MTTPTAPADDITLPADQLPLIASTSPERIWLDVGEEAATHHTETRFRDLHEVTWSEDNASGYGVEYVRADRASPSRAAVQPGAMEAAAQWVEARCEAYANEHGSTDPETGTTEYPGDGAEYVGELMEIAEGLRALAPPPPPRVDDLSTLVSRLARSLRQAAPDNDLPEKAVDYLRRHGLTGSPLRDVATVPAAVDVGAAQAETMPAIFNEWLPKAYRQPQESYTVHNMEVAFVAGQQSAAAAIASGDSLDMEGGRESLEDALAVVESFGQGVQGLNDTFARQVLLAAEVRRLRVLYIKAVAGRSDFRDALRTERRAAAQAETAQAAPDEQSAFEDWLSSECPSGDVESVQRQWLESSDFRNFLDEQDAARATPGATHGN